MREYPWHERYATAKHQFWFKNLVELHDLTNAWLQDVQTDRTAHQLTRGLSKTVVQNLWMLESLSGTSLEQLLDENGPDDTLLRLEQTVSAVQAWTLRGILEKTSSAEKQALQSILEQTSFKMGRRSAEVGWKPPLPAKMATDLRAVLQALLASPFAGFPRGEGLLVRRATSSQVDLELRLCPHHSDQPEVHNQADELCELHTHWMRGFAYALNNRVTVEHKIKKPRCILYWRFVS